MFELQAERIRHMVVSLVHGGRVIDAPCVTYDGTRHVYSVATVDGRAVLLLDWALTQKRTPVHQALMQSVGVAAV